MKTMTKAEAAEKIGCTDKNLGSWLKALGMCIECTRCHGSGKFSFNMTSGDVCFGCSGSGKMLPKLTAATVDAAAAKVAAGDMVPHLARWRAQNAAKRSLAGLVAEGQVYYHTIGEAYEEWYQATRNDNGHEEPPVQRAQQFNNALRGAIWDLQSDVKWGKRRDYVQVAREARRLVAALRGLRMAWLSHEAGTAVRCAA